MENNARLNELLDIYMKGALSEIEKAELLGYFNNPVFLAEIGELLGQAFDRESGDHEMPRIQQEQLLSDVFHADQPKLLPVSVRKLWAFATAGAAVIAFVFCITFFLTRQNPDPGTPLVNRNEIVPGKPGATLILASGQKIRLTGSLKGKLANEAGVIITKTADGQLLYKTAPSAPGKISGLEQKTGLVNTLSTAKGETFSLLLPDGSKVVLNAASSLTYAPGLYQNGERKVKLSGEGYFEVTKDKAHPFIVENDGQRVKVLGTHFNINAYPDEPVRATTLIEGMIVISNDQDSRVLKPGEQAVDQGASFKVVKADIESIVDWREGHFYLNHIPFKTAMRKIARWYDIEVIYNASVPEDLEIGGWISRSESLATVLQSIESAGLVHFKVEGRRIYVSK